MLQQTQVARVLERFDPFMERYPCPRDLAAADEQEVLTLWQGLGYYRRARNLHRAAQVIVSDFGGEVPLDVKSLLTLPGVGRYTAGSMASIVGGERAPIVDGNVTRVLARLHCDDGRPEDRAYVKRTWQRAESLVLLCDHPALLNEGMMELGAMVCTPKAPLCSACPVQSQCGAWKAGSVADIPPPKRAAKRTVLHHHAVVIRRGSTVLLEQRDDSGLWAGLWQAPAIEADRELPADVVGAKLGYGVEDIERVGTLTRVLTHRTVHIYVHAATLSPDMQDGVGEGAQWASIDDLASIPLSNAAIAVLNFGS
jgi:A/G-specific adenine glycosylase